MIRQAEQSVTMEKYERALDAARNALELSKEAGDLQGEGLALFYIGKAYEGQKQNDEALRTYFAALEVVKHIDASELEAYLLESQGNLFFQIHEYKQAEQCFNRYIELIPDDPRGYYNRGRANRNLKEYQRAIEDYNHALKLDPEYVYAYNGRGNAYADLKEYKRAIEDYDRALELDPKYIDAYNNRGRVYYELKEYKRSVEEYTWALELDPKHVLAYNNRGLAYYDLKEYERTVKDFQYSIELDPENSVIYLLLGYSYLWLKDIKQAHKAFLQSWQLELTNINYSLMAEWTTMYQKKPDPQMAERLETVAANAPEDVVAFICRGIAFWIHERFEEALSELNQAIPLNPELEDTFFWKGVVLAYMGPDNDAVAAIEKSLELDLPPLLLSPLRWLEQDRPDFYHKYAASLLARFEV